jgi:hypothetical protein
MTNKINDKLLFWIDRLSSVQLTLVCLGLAMVLVVFGTLAQVHMGTFAAQKEYFNSWWIYGDLGDSRVPVFPGGLSVGALWLINLLAAFAMRFTFQRKDTGILISHFGLILLLMGQFLTQSLAYESNMPIEVGKSSNYTQAFRDTELVLIKSVDADLDEVTSIPSSLLSREIEIHPPRRPFYLVVHRFIKNAQLGMAPSPQALSLQGEGGRRPGEGPPSLATQGIGTRVSAQEIPPVTSDDDVNTPAVYVEVREGARSLGVWLVSSGLGAPQSFFSGGDEYRLAMRPRRYYLPFTLTLKEFHHDIYPGTDIPRNFSSLVHLSDPAKHEERDILIYMNHPLRYGGKTFYQASFGEGDQLSVFQVVQNPTSAGPYVSCALVVLGLAVQFFLHLLDFLRKRT